MFLYCHVYIRIIFFSCKYFYSCIFSLLYVYVQCLFGNYLYLQLLAYFYVMLCLIHFSFHKCVVLLGMVERMCAGDWSVYLQWTKSKSAWKEKTQQSILRTKGDSHWLNTASITQQGPTQPWGSFFDSNPPTTVFLFLTQSSFFNQTLEGADYPVTSALCVAVDLICHWMRLDSYLNESLLHRCATQCATDSM